MELVVVSAIFSVLSLLVYVTFAFESQAFARNTNVNATQRALRVWLARMESDIRLAGYNPLETSPNPFAVTARSCTDFEFALDADGDGSLATSGDAYNKENLGYRLNATTHALELKNGTTWRPVVDDVQTLNFTYRRGDAQRTILNSDCSATTTWPTQDIHEVQITITAQAAAGIPGASPVTIAASTNVELRNALP